MPSAERLTSTEPPTSVEPAGGVYCRSSLESTGAAASVLRIAYIGVLGPQFEPLLEPYPGLPVVKLDQPSLDAAD